MEPARLLRAVEIMAHHATLDDERLGEVMCNEGFSSQQAAELLAFVPLAFGRPLLEELGVKEFSSTVSAPSRAGGRRNVPLRYQAAYIRSLSLARQHWRTGELGDVYEAVALRSAEVIVVNKALNEGVGVKGGTLSVAIFGPYAESLNQGPWWLRLWSRHTG
jgi:hypothetical protein